MAPRGIATQQSRDTRKNNYICPLDESVMRRLKLDITFATLGPIGI